MKYINDERSVTPNISGKEYVRYINLREITCHSLAGLVTMESSLPCKTHVVYQHASPHVWVESPTSSLEYKIDNTQAISGCNIQASNFL